MKELPAKGMLGCSIKAKSSQPHNPSDKAMPFIFNPETDQLSSKLAGILFSIVMEVMGSFALRKFGECLTSQI